MNCLICGQKVGLSSTKLKNGVLCNSCCSQLPSLMIDGKPYLQEFTLKNAMEYVKENAKKFCATASYGDLHIDSQHGLFAIAKKLDENGKPKAGNNVFSVYDLSDVAIFCKSPRADHNNVLVDVEFRFQLENPYLNVSTIIKRSVKCQTKRVDSQHVEWDEPSDLDMFRTLFNQMLSGAFVNVNDILCGKTVHEFEIEKARTIFMLTENYTSEDLKRARRLMMKDYHPDIAKEDVTREAQIINNAYNLLKAELEKNSAEN